MYIPSAFAQTDQAALFDLIEANSFALLVSTGEQNLVASHLPLLLDREVPPNGRIIGHMARANPQWRAMANREALCVFSGPHAYVSPAWYGADDMVPTWNYLAVHAYGTCRIVDDEAGLARIVADYVRTYEGSMTTPWRLDTRAHQFKSLLKAIVGFEIDIARLEGKWKLGQNHSPERRASAARHLADSEHANPREIARQMRATLE